MSLLAAQSGIRVRFDKQSSAGMIASGLFQHANKRVAVGQSRRDGMVAHGLVDDQDALTLSGRGQQKGRRVGGHVVLAQAVAEYGGHGFPRLGQQGGSFPTRVVEQVFQVRGREAS